MKAYNACPDHPAIRMAELTGYPEGEPEAALYCTECGQEIYEGEDYYEIGGLALCERCTGGHRAVAEREGRWNRE